MAILRSLLSRSLIIRVLLAIVFLVQTVGAVQGAGTGDEAPELSELTPEKARLLVERVGEPIFLNEVTSISDEVAGILGECHCPYLSLGRLTELTATQAESLARCDAGLQLNGLNEISNEVAAKLASHKHEYGLSLGGLRELPEEVAKALGDHDHLGLDGVLHLSTTATAAISRNRGMLDLSGLREISDEQARIFGSRRGALMLGVRVLTDSQAENLARHRGELGLNYIAHLSDKQAEALARHKSGEVILSGLSDASNTAIQKLKSNSDIWLPLHLR